MIKNLAAKAKRSEKEVEYLWHKAKAIVKAEYDVDEEDGAFWGLTTGITKKMLGMSESLSFKQFIEESFSANTMSLEKTAEYFKQHGSQYAWMLDDEKYIWRGDRKFNTPTGKANIVDVNKTTRVSANTSNHYTLIFDNHPEMKDFPKRSKSLICSTDYDRAKQYQGFLRGAPYIILPTNNSTIGFVKHLDIWDVYVELFGKSMSISTANDVFYSLRIKDDSIKSFYDFADRLKDRESKEALALEQSLLSRNIHAGDEVYENLFNDFVGEVFKAFSPSKTEMDWAHGEAAKDFMHDHQEVWVDGTVIVLNTKDIHKFKKLVLS